MLLHTLPNGDEVLREGNSIIVRLHGRRKTLSSSAPNGGLHIGLTSVFNHDSKPESHKNCRMLAPTMAEHMALEAQGIGLDAAQCTGLITAADMDNAAIRQLSYDDFSVTAIVTGGIEENGGRVGDPASWHEKQGVTLPLKLGTVNTILYISADLTDEALVRALITCTEAKCAAIQELAAASCYSSGLATGSGTDGTVIICDAESPVLLTSAGKHYKLGELIGRTVIPALKEALYKQTGLGPAMQHDVFRRLGRWGLAEADMLEELPPGCSAADLRDLATEGRMVAAAALYAHLLDELAWQLLSPDEAADAAAGLLGRFGYDPPQAPLGTADLIAAWRQMMLEQLKP